MLVTRRVLLFAALAAGCVTSDIEDETATLTACPMSNLIEDPPPFVWTYHDVSPQNPEPYYSGILEYGEATFTIGAYTLTTRAYRQAGGTFTIPGPTIRVEPGNKYILRFHNLLPYEASTDPTDHNTFHDPNVTNVHTHGLHISGESPSDDVTRMFEGQRGGDYVWDIPADHMGGTYWYHAHHHGSTFLQVATGGFGQLIVDDSSDGIPPLVAGMPERQLIVAYLDPTVAGTGGDTLISGSMPAAWTVNGTLNGNFCMPAGEWQHWRVLLADRNATEKVFTVGSNCQVELLARDGVWRTVAPQDRPTNFVRLTGASRADLAVKCTNDSTLMINNNPIASVLVSGSGDTTVGPWSNGPTGSTWSAIRPNYLRDLRGETSVHNEGVSMSARTINSKSFDENVPTFTLDANQVQNWTLTGANNHPFHLHVYHVQSQNCTGSYEPGEYFDTIANACTVRFDLDAATSTVYEGRTIMHCHILDHEDQGAMGWLDTVGGVPPPEFPDDASLVSPYGESYAQGSIDWCTADGTCDDGDMCNGAETCATGGECAAGAPLVCDDGNVCNGSETCSPGSGCASGTPLSCDDGNVCNGIETCSPGSGCASGTPLGCDDGKACTADSCDPVAGCVHTPTCPVTLGTDDFESGTWAGGTLWYDPAWTATGDALVTGTDTPHAGSWHARLRRATGKIWRRARRKNTSNLHLKFWAKVSTFEPGDIAEVKVTQTGGVLTTVKTFTSADSDGAYHFYDVDLTGLVLPSLVKVTFDAGMSAIDDVWTIDDVELTGYK